MPRLPGPDERVLRGEPSADGAADGGSAPSDDGLLAESDLSVLHAAAKLRFPDLTTMRGAVAVSALQDHIARTAIVRGELYELRLRARVRLRSDRRRWRRLHVPRKTRTESETDRLKYELDPDLGDRIADAEWIIEECREAMKRMDADYEHASREYTIIAGGG